MKVKPAWLEWLTAPGRRLRPVTRTEGEEFLDQLGAKNWDGFEGLFARLSTILELGSAMDGQTLGLLYEAAFLAVLCRISFNGLGGCGGRIKPEREPNRVYLERHFMDACARFWSCPGCEGLSEHRQESIRRVFLTVQVEQVNLAG